MQKWFGESPKTEIEDVIRRMAWMAEYHDPYLFNHLGRIRGYVSILATGLGLPSAEVEMIGLASQLHDIGKIALPEPLRTNKGNLTNAEMEASNKHTTVGAELLNGSSIQVFQVGAVICLSHHERWDGSGYPQGSRGQQIPVSGRITSLADVFDALTSSRSYKKEVPLPEARRLILETSGQLFDPTLVQIFDDRFDDFYRIRQMNI